MKRMADRITVFLADDNVIVRDGVRALLALEPDLEVVGTAGDYDELISGAEDAAPQVLVTDIRMPPSFQSEGIDAAKELRKRHPGTGVVVLSQYDDPEYAVSLLADDHVVVGEEHGDRPFHCRCPHPCHSVPSSDPQQGCPRPRGSGCQPPPCHGGGPLAQPSREPVPWAEPRV